jgi:hypothetical protein
MAGLWVSAVTRFYFTSLPVVLVAIVLGRALNQRLDGNRFIVYVHIGLVVIGGMLLVRSALGWGRSQSEQAGICGSLLGGHFFLILRSTSEARSRNCPPLILAPQVDGIFTSRFTSS